MKNISTHLPILDLDTLIKYKKGNLLGDKKKQVELALTESEFLREALEGLDHVNNLHKLEAKIDKINERIAFKADGKVGKNTKPLFNFNKKLLLTISAAAAILIIGIWSFSLVNQYVSNKNTLALKESRVKEEPEVIIKPNKEKAPFKANDSVLGNQFALSDTNSVVEAQDALVFAPEIIKNDNPSETKSKIIPKNEENSKKTLAEAKTRLKRKEETKDIMAPVMNEEENTSLDKETAGSNIKTTSSTLARAGAEEEKKLSPIELAQQKAKNGDISQAINDLETLSKTGSTQQKDEANLALAKLYIKEGDKRKAKKLLKNFEDTSHLKSAAEQLLKEL